LAEATCITVLLEVPAATTHEPTAERDPAFARAARYEDRRCVEKACSEGRDQPSRQTGLQQEVGTNRSSVGALAP
jgi:hypothetical protein